MSEMPEPRNMLKLELAEIGTLDVDFDLSLTGFASGEIDVVLKAAKAPDGSARRSLYTHFEAADARGFVPSWDEPDYKAHWDLSALISASQMAVGNLPAARTELLPGGLKRVTFATTPLMSSYLLFLGAGDFGRIATRVGTTDVAITMTKGNEAKARTALDAEAQVLSYPNEYFGTRYPLPKLENIAGPGDSGIAQGDLAGRCCQKRRRGDLGATPRARQGCLGRCRADNLTRVARSGKG